MNQDKEFKRKKMIAGLALLAIAAATIGTAIIYPASNTVAMETRNPNPVATQKISLTSKQPTTTPSSTPTSSDYRDGTYRAVGTYFSPGGQESVSVSLTLSNSMVTAASVQSGANDPTAQSYQDSFISGYKSFVIGKKINKINLTNVSGSSLTSQGFNNALSQIEHQAKT